MGWGETAAGWRGEARGVMACEWRMRAGSRVVVWGWTVSSSAGLSDEPGAGGSESVGVELLDPAVLFDESGACHIGGAAAAGVEGEHGVCVRRGRKRDSTQATGYGA